MSNARTNARLSRLEDKGNSPKRKYTRYLFSSLSAEDQERMMRFEFAFDYENRADDLAKAMAEAMGWDINHARAYIIRNDVERAHEESECKARGEPDPLERHPIKDLTDADIKALGLAMLDGVADVQELSDRMGWRVERTEAFLSDVAEWEAAQSPKPSGHPCERA
ncbi:hypothetical protein LG047_15795 [Methylocystis sp. WRRC1]|uniref:hypothetical protein n=1 Tax=Methylocystis sp. WRRC1 TaxID=1732014 RepID=UPI001D13F7A6|nr:hypothetical protein [Methylocystis sp. WRRC1]MCC3246762.1 hypothetical protein [Methylocystis sp. WRRC1]